MDLTAPREVDLAPSGPSVDGYPSWTTRPGSTAALSDLSRPRFQRLVVLVIVELGQPRVRATRSGPARSPPRAARAVTGAPRSRVSTADQGCESSSHHHVTSSARRVPTFDCARVPLPAPARGTPDRDRCLLPVARDEGLGLGEAALQDQVAVVGLAVGRSRRCHGRRASSGGPRRGRRSGRGPRTAS